MTGNIHGRMNRCLEGTVKLEKLLFVDFAPAIFNSIAAIITIFTTLPFGLALPMMLVIPIGIFIVFKQFGTIILDSKNINSLSRKDISEEEIIYLEVKDKE